MSVVTDDRVEALRTWIAEQQIGVLAPLDVLVAQEDDADGREAWVLTITLDAPTDAEGIWSVADVAEFERQVRDRAIDWEVPWPWHLRYRSAGGDVATDWDDSEG